MPSAATTSRPQTRFSSADEGTTFSLVAVGASFSRAGPGADDLSGGTSCSTDAAGQCYADIDTVSYAKRTTRVHATANGFAGDYDQRLEHHSIAADVERIIGGMGNDFLGGTTTNVSFADRSLSSSLPECSSREEGVTTAFVADERRLPPWRQGRRRIRGAGRGDLLQGGRGDDRLVGDSGRDRLSGGKGQDRLFARDGHVDHVNGGAGTDAAQIDAALDHLARTSRTLSLK